MVVAVGFANAVAHKSITLIGDVQLTDKLAGDHARFFAAHQEDGINPLPDRDMRALKDRTKQVYCSVSVQPE